MEEEYKFIDLEDLSFESLFSKAEEAFSEFQYSKARAFYELAYKKSPKNEDFLCNYAFFLRETGEIPLSIDILKQALLIEDKSSQNYKKYMQMGELLTGDLSLDLYERGVEIMNRLYNPIVAEDPTQNEIKRDLALGHSAIGELYQTDLIGKMDSEEKCRIHLEKALEIDNKCLDAYLQLVNYYLNKEDKNSAAKYLDVLYNEITKENGENDKENEEEIELGLRKNVGNLFIELADYQKAGKVLDGCYDEMAEDSELVYLLGFCRFKEGKYRESLELMEELGKMEIKDKEIKEAAEELMGELGKIKWEDEKEEENEKEVNEEEWMDIE